MPTPESSVFTERCCSNLLSNTQGCKTLKIKERDLFISQFWRLDRKVALAVAFQQSLKVAHSITRQKKKGHACMPDLLIF